MKFLTSIIFTASLTACAYTYACPLCSTKVGEAVRHGIFTNYFLFTLNTIGFIFLLFVLITILISNIIIKIMSNKNFNTGKNTSNSNVKISKSYLFAIMLFGGSMAGFIDGIFFHQIFQLHGMISNLIPLNSLVHIEINMFWDGIFHAFTLFILIVSSLMLWKAPNLEKCQETTALMVGLILIGAGVFNLIEGIIDHQLLQLHHVIQQSAIHFNLFGDVIYLLFALLLVGIGSSYIKKYCEA